MANDDDDDPEYNFIQSSRQIRRMYKEIKLYQIKVFEDWATMIEEGELDEVVAQLRAMAQQFRKQVGEE